MTAWMNCADEFKIYRRFKMIQIQQIHHVAYRCRDAKETAEWYKKNLNMDLLVCIAEDRVPSTKEPDPYMHIFLDAGCGNILAFFEITGSPPMISKKAKILQNGYSILLFKFP